MMLLFTRSQYLILLLAIPVMIAVHFFAIKKIKKRAIKFANFEAITRIKGIEIFSKNLTVLYINTAIIILVVFAVSGISIARNVDASEMSFVLAIDASRSMSAQDIMPDRFEAAKKAAVDFLNLVPEKTKVAIISFSSNAFIEQELTEDKEKLNFALNALELKMTGGTDILGAVATSVNLLRDENGKTIILISDGQANVNELKDIINYANQNNVMIHSLGIGTREGGSDETGAVFKLSEDSLEIIASKTEGRYYNVNNLEDFYSSLNEIIKVTKKRDITDITLYAMISALILFIINFVLINTRYRVLP